MSNKSLSTKGAFGKQTTRRKTSVTSLTKFTNELLKQLSIQQNTITEYFGVLTQITEALEKTIEESVLDGTTVTLQGRVPDWIVKKAREALDNSKPVNQVV